MSEGKVLNIGSKRTLLLLCLLLLVAFVVFLVTLLREPVPPEQQGKMAKSETPQMVRGQIQLPQPIEISGPTAPPAAPPPAAPATRELAKEPPSAASVAQETPGPREGELPKPVEKTPAAAPMPTPVREKAQPAREMPQPSQVAAVERKEESPPASTSGLKYTIQVGAFSSKERAEKLASQLREGGFEATVESGPTGSGRIFHRVLVGSFSEILEAKKMEARLQSRKDIKETLVKKIK